MKFDERCKIKNILLITVDALRADHLGCMGYHRNTTPKIDELAKKGILFSQTIANGSGTPSAVPPILTSTYPLMYGGYEYLSKDRITIAEILKKSGYSTAAFHSNVYLSKFYGYGRGFDVFYDDLSIDLDESRYRKFRKFGRKFKTFHKLCLNYLNGTIFAYRRNAWHLPYVSADIINKMTISWIKENKDSKFFTWVHYMDVHAPYMPPHEYVKEINKNISKYQVLKANRYYDTANYKAKKISKMDVNNLIDLYDAGIKYMDSAIYSLINELEALGVLKETLVILTADHGEEFFEHGDLSHHSKLYDELIHVPLIMYSPEFITENKVIEDQVEHLDIAPTILDVLGVENYTNFVGDSLIPLIEGKKCEEKGVISETSDPPNKLKIVPHLKKTSYRTKIWKYIHNESKKDELYNLLQDPKETINLVDNKKEIAHLSFLKIMDHINMENKHQPHSKKAHIRNKIKRMKIKRNI